MTWPVLLILAAGTLAMKVLGATLFTRRPIPKRFERLVKRLPVVIYPALVASATLGSDGVGIHPDARLLSAGIVLVVVIVFRKRHLFGVAMLIGAAATAAIRLLQR